MELHITCIPGDGIGPEIIREAKKVLEKVAETYGHRMVFEDILMGGASIDVHGVPLTEEAVAKAKAADAVLMGSIGMLASASLNDSKFGLYEPSHGSAPDIAGQDIANPIATVLSAAMMLRYSFDLDKEADAIEEAVKQVLKDGYRTGDIYSEGCEKVGCSGMGSLLAERIVRK